MTLVVDGSVVVAALVDTGPDGAWAERVLGSEPLAAPHLMPGGVANVLRRAAAAGDISADVASLAHDDLLSLRVDPFPYEPCAARVWELRSTITAHGGWYVALAEALDAPLPQWTPGWLALEGPGAASSCRPRAGTLTEAT